MQRENSNTQTPKLITPLPALLPLQKREMPSQAGFFLEQGGFWMPPPHPHPQPLSHSSPGNGALDLTLLQETIRIISYWAERKWNFK